MNLFCKKFTCKSKLKTTFISIIPFLFYISKHTTSNQRFTGGEEIKNHKGYVYAVHITPFLTFGVNYGRKTSVEKEQS